jgi:hypothetical protein
MFLYMMLFAVVFIVLISAVLVNVFLSSNDPLHDRFGRELVDSKHLDDVLFH